MLAIAIFLCILTASLLVYCFTFSYNGTIQHFDKSPIVYCAYASLFLCAASAVASYFIAGKNTEVNPAPKRVSFAETFFAILAALLCILCGFTAVTEGMPETKVALAMLRIAFYFIGAIYFAITAFATSSYKGKLSFAAYSVIPALLFAVLIPNYYFNAAFALNSATLFLNILICISFMLFFTFEIAIGIGKPLSARKYLFASVLSVSCGGAASLSALATEILSNDGFDSELLNAVFYTAVWLYITVKAFGICKTAFIPQSDVPADADYSLSFGNDGCTEESSSEETNEEEKQEESDNI